MDRTIASIYFEDLHFERPLYGGNYTLAAVAKDAAPSRTRITDKIQMEPLPQISGGGSIPRVITAESIALDILAHATEKGFGMTMDCAPGVWIVREFVPEVDADGQPVMTTTFDDKGKPIHRQAMRPATTAEREQMYNEDLEQARQRQYNYAEWLTQQGNILAEEPEKIILITKSMRKAAIYNGHDVAWKRQLRHDDNKLCPFCGKSVAAGVIKCAHCQEVIDFERYAELEAERSAAVQKARKRAG